MLMLAVESAMKKIEDDNTLVFIVDKRANKPQIKTAVQRLYSVKVEKVNTLLRYHQWSWLYFLTYISPDGQKKAFVRLAADCEALDVANKVLTWTRGSFFSNHSFADRHYLNGEMTNKPYLDPFLLLWKSFKHPHRVCAVSSNELMGWYFQKRRGGKSYVCLKSS